MAASRPGGISGRSRRTDGGSWPQILTAISPRASPENGTVPGEQLEQNDAERPDVRPRVDVLRVLDLLRGHVTGRAP